MKISSVEQLVKRGTLERGDELIFEVNKDRYRYCVKGYYCDNINPPHENNIIFNELRINKTKIAEIFYGHTILTADNDSTGWPEYSEGDFESLTRLVMGLFVMTDQWATKEAPIKMVYIPDFNNDYPMDLITTALKHYFATKD